MKPSFPRAPRSRKFVKSQALVLFWLPGLKIASKTLRNRNLFFLISFMQISFQNAVQSDNVITELNKNKGAGELVKLGKGRCFSNELRRDVGRQEAKCTCEALSPPAQCREEQGVPQGQA